jgi:hypothetical protein
MDRPAAGGNGGQELPLGAPLPEPPQRLTAWEQEQIRQDEEEAEWQAKRQAAAAAAAGAGDEDAAGAAGGVAPAEQPAAEPAAELDPPAGQQGQHSEIMQHSLGDPDPRWWATPDLLALLPWGQQSLAVAVELMSRMPSKHQCMVRLLPVVFQADAFQVFFRLVTERAAQPASPMAAAGLEPAPLDADSVARDKLAWAEFNSMLDAHHASGAAGGVGVGVGVGVGGAAPAVMEQARQARQPGEDEAGPSAAAAPTLDEDWWAGVAELIELEPPAPAAEEPPPPQPGQDEAGPPAAAAPHVDPRYEQFWGSEAESDSEHSAGM